MGLSPPNTSVISFNAAFDPSWEYSQEGVYVSRAPRGHASFSGSRIAPGSQTWLLLTVPDPIISQKIMISVNGYELGICRMEPRTTSARRRFEMLIPSSISAQPVLHCLLVADVGVMRVLNMSLEVEPAHGLKADVTDQEVMAKFASIGCDCEFGFAQRAVGIEPLGLLRFAGARTIFNLIHHLKAGFSDLLEPNCFEAGINGYGQHAEWFMSNKARNYVFHTWQHPDSITQEAVTAKTENKVRYLVRSFIEDIEDGEKILLYKSFEYLDHHEIIALYRALSCYGKPKLFCVTRPIRGRPTGSLERISNHIVQGFFKGMIDNGQLGDRDGWLSLCHTAYRVFEGASQEPLLARSYKEQFEHPGPNFKLN